MLAPLAGTEGTRDVITMRMAKLVGGAALLVGAALVGGTLIGGVLAAPGRTDSGTNADADPRLLGSGAGEYCQVFLDTFAAQLGVSTDDLLPAGKTAAKAAIDAAVADGKLDADRAAEMKDRIDALDEAGCGVIGALGPGFAPGFGPGFIHGFGHGFVRGFVQGDLFDAAADALGITNAELAEAMADGTSLQELAESHGVAYADVKAAALAALDENLDAAVERGLSQDRADALHDMVQTWLDNGGEPPSLWPGRPGRFGLFDHGVMRDS
jgi:hypothetical protein